MSLDIMSEARPEGLGSDSLVAIVGDNFPMPQRPATCSRSQTSASVLDRLDLRESVLVGRVKPLCIPLPKGSGKTTGEFGFASAYRDFDFFPSITSFFCP